MRQTRAEGCARRRGRSPSRSEGNNPMSATDLPAILPLLVLSTTAVVLLLGIAIQRSHTLTLAIATGGLLLPCICPAPRQPLRPPSSAWMAPPHLPRPDPHLLPDHLPPLPRYLIRSGVPSACLLSGIAILCARLGTLYFLSDPRVAPGAPGPQPGLRGHPPVACGNSPSQSVHRENSMRWPRAVTACRSEHWSRAASSVSTTTCRS